MYDSGVMFLHRGANVAEPGEAPELVYVQIWGANYENRTVGVQRYYTAMEHANRADLLIRVPRYYAVSPTTDRVTLSPVDHLDDGTYRVAQVQQVTDSDGLPATDITLERMDALDGNH